MVFWESVSLLLLIPWRGDLLMSILIIRWLSVWFKIDFFFFFSEGMISVCFQYLFLAKWKKQSWLSRVVILFTHDGYAVENTVNFLSNCILYFPQCQLYWMIVRFTLGFHLFLLKLSASPKGTIKTPSVSVGPALVPSECYLCPSLALHAYHWADLHEVMHVKSL